MTEEERDVTNQESVNPEESTVNNIDASNSEQPTEDQEESKQAKKDYNWRQMEKKNEELADQVNELLRREEERNKPKPPPEEDDVDILSPDDIITVEQSDKRTAMLVKKAIKEERLNQEKHSLPDRTRKKFNDFDSVMTNENIKKLEQEEPDLADMCSKASNPWEATYKILKKFMPPIEERQSSQAEKKLDENLSKPGSINSVGKVKPLSNANMWSESSRDRLYKEMMEAARRV